MAGSGRKRKHNVRHGSILSRNHTMKLVIDSDRCKGCNLCMLVCPYRIFKEGKDQNERGIIIPELDRPERCPNYKRKTKKNAVCEMCILTCPDQALYWDEEAGEP